jgi:hypothetical protein
MTNKQQAIDSGSYIKPGKHFKFPHSLRGLLSSITDKKARDEFRAQIVQATLHGNRLPEKKAKKEPGALIQVVTQ